MSSRLGAGHGPDRPRLLPEHVRGRLHGPRRPSFRLALGAKTITRNSRKKNGANQTLLTAAGKMLTRMQGDFRPGNGLYYGGRLSCRVNEVAFDLVSTAPHVLCRNQKEGSGYSDLKQQTMKDKVASSTPCSTTRTSATR